MAINLPRESPSPTPRNTRLTIVAVVAAVAGLWYAQDFLIPLFFAALLSYALRPLHRRLVSWRLPQSLAAVLVLVGVLAVTGAGAFVLHGQATAFVERLPELSQRFRQAIRSGRGAFSSTVQPVQQAANELQKAADESTLTPPRGVTRVQIEEPPMRLTDLVWRGTLGALELGAQATIVLFLVFYLLASGDRNKGRVVRIAGSSFFRRQMTIEILDDITEQIERFILARVWLSTFVGVGTGLVVWSLGLSQPAMWGLAAGILNNIPYLGPVAAIAAMAAAAFVQFGTMAMTGAVAGTTAFIAFLEGFVLTPWLMGRAGRMNPAVVFVSLMFWGWIWGVWGMLFAVPIMMCVKAYCDHMPEYKFASELLSE